ncbi:hypothetical protein BH11PSE11_BH11PSE11_23230 [soil metagenome]
MSGTAAHHQLLPPPMSIAVSAVIRPSRTLLIMVGGMCLCIFFSAALIATGRIGNLAAQDGIMLASVLAVITLSGLTKFLRLRKMVRLDISGAGQIRLSDSRLQGNSGTAENDSLWNPAQEVYLAGNSTLWPHILLLSLRSQDGKTSVLPIMRDSVASGEFRMLSVACRWIAAHNTSAENS